MDRRSFMTLFGGFAAVGLGGAGAAQAASRSLEAAPVAAASQALDSATSAALDKADAEFSQAIVRERVIVRRPRPYRGRRRPVVVRRTIIRRPRRTIVRRRVIVR